MLKERQTPADQYGPWNALTMTEGPDVLGDVSATAPTYSEAICIAAQLILREVLPEKVHLLRMVPKLFPIRKFAWLFIIHRFCSDE